MIMKTMAMYNIEKAATANNSITWMKIFKVKKRPKYNMINHDQGKSQTWNNITSDSSCDYGQRNMFNHRIPL